MNRSSNFLKGLFVVFGFFVVLTLIIGYSPLYGLASSAIAGLSALFVLPKPFRPTWLGGRLVSGSVLCLAVVGMVVSGQIAENHKRELAARERELAAQETARLQDLRRTNPQAYLSELKSAGDVRWEGEFQVLDPGGYKLFAEERRRLEETARKEEITKITQQLSRVPASDVDVSLALYSRLVVLDPANRQYRSKADALNKQVGEARAKRELQETQRTHPEKFVSIESFSWSKEGFGSVMEANFTIKNSLPWPIKDILVQCSHAAPSGTTIDSNTRTIYERIEPNKTKQIRKFNMGFIHSQAQRSGCEVTKVIALY
jgi:hypothetical protein